MPTPRRCPAPWSIDEQAESFTVKDATGQALACVDFENEPQRQMSMKALSRNEASLMAVNIAKLPSVTRQILKDIPRPPHNRTTSRQMTERLSVSSNRDLKKAWLALIQ
jgi:hypothetical protein